MKWIILLLIMMAPAVHADTRTVLTALGLSNHTAPGVTSGDEPIIELAPGLEVPAYNEKNVGLAIGWHRPNTWVMLGRYKNSFFGYSRFLWSGVGVNVGDYQLGMLGGFVDGYEDKIQGVLGAYVRSGGIMLAGGDDLWFLTFDVVEW